MDTLDDIRTTRAILSWIFEPGQPWLTDLLTTHGPVSAVGLLSRRQVPRSVLREVHRSDPSQLWARAARAATRAQRGTDRLLIPEDPDWPAGLRDLTAATGGVAPLCLWARGPGSIPEPQNSVTMTGARACTSYGIHVAADLIRGLTDRDYTLITSAGYGIADAVLRRALAAKAAAVAVLPYGLDQPYPAWSGNLHRRLTARGLLLSHWAPTIAPTRSQMRACRHLIAALSGGTVLVEAHPHSGAVQTLKQAVTLGRAAMAVPGPLTSLMSTGCHQLLRADTRIRPVTSAADIITDIKLASRR